MESDRVQEEEEELLEELGYEVHGNSTILRDRNLLQLSFSLKQGSLTLLSSPSPSSRSPSPPSLLPFLGPEPLVGLIFSSLGCSLDLRPRVRCATFELSLGGLTIEDHVDSLSQFPVLVKHKGAEVRKTERGIKALCS